MTVTYEQAERHAAVLRAAGFDIVYLSDGPDGIDCFDWIEETDSTAIRFERRPNGLFDMPSIADLRALQV